MTFKKAAINSDENAQANESDRHDSFACWNVDALDVETRCALLSAFAAADEGSAGASRFIVAYLDGPAPDALEAVPPTFSAGDPLAPRVYIAAHSAPGGCLCWAL